MNEIIMYITVFMVFSFSIYMIKEFKNFFKHQQF